MSLSEKWGKDAGQMVAIGNPQWVNRWISSVRFAIGVGAGREKGHVTRKLCYNHVIKLT